VELRAVTRLWWACKEAMHQEWASAGGPVCSVALGAWQQGAGQLAGLGRMPWRLLVLLSVDAALSSYSNCRLC